MSYGNPDLYLHLHHDNGRELSERAHRRHLEREALRGRWARRFRAAVSRRVVPDGPATP